MHPTVATAAKECLHQGGKELVKMYTDTALLLNACEVTALAYAARTDNFQLSTTQNIPEPIRLPVELDVVVHRTELPTTYRGPVLQRIAEDFFIRMISVVDGTLEDIYEATLPLIVLGITDDEILKKVRSAWQVENNGHVKLLNFLVDEAGLISPQEKTSTVQMVFDRYYEMREIRHALVHTSGELSQKHLRRLSDFAARLPVELRHCSLAHAPFVRSGIVLLTTNDLLSLRHWAYTTILGYLQRAFDVSTT